MNASPDTLIQIDVTDRQGRSARVSGRVGTTLMHALTQSGLPIAATCSGAMSCATCHVYLDEGLERVGHPDENELDLLCESAHHRPEHSRLSCQVFLDLALDGLRCTLAPSH